MPSSRQHQQAHGIGQIEKQLNNQAEAAEEIQGDTTDILTAEASVAENKKSKNNKQ
ncbi:hypothetical protein [Paenibacillus abyssi]|uniref:Uncharacterized protein n=1 Tax=Paenibacillus abyssi TaxID=1340531 RepID=A0A917CZX4_9BACL|nr:hypothetical protein [Paenibacillus abyssi]GGG06282.1 hypothetical protein GCM10010916_24070 [Paenibacillus abyssi]